MHHATAGVDDEFVCVGRLDNLGMSFCSLQALLDCYRNPSALQDEEHIKAVALFDHEEVGSSSAQGVLSADQITTASYSSSDFLKLHLALSLHASKLGKTSELHRSSVPGVGMTSQQRLWHYGSCHRPSRIAIRLFCSRFAPLFRLTLGLAAGAGGPVMRDTITRVTGSLAGELCAA